MSLSLSLSVDVWSSGCILAELINRKPLFPGSNCCVTSLCFSSRGPSFSRTHTHTHTRCSLALPHTDLDQLRRICRAIGTPSPDVPARMGGKQLPSDLHHYDPQPWETICPNTSPLGLDLLAKMLKFDPAERINVDEALAHPYLAALHDPEDEVALCVCVRVCVSQSHLIMVLHSQAPTLLSLISVSTRTT